MKTLLAILKSRLFLGSLGVGLVLVLVLMLGAWLDWSLTVRLACVVGILVVALAVLVISFVRAQRNAAQIQAQIQAQGEDQRMSTRPEKREDIEQLQRELNSSIERLKKSKLGRGHRAPLYALPWYMMIGPPGVGKTVALANSGLDFPMGAGRRHGVGGTRNCDWFFSDSAILLDTAGRYMTEHEDTEEWFAFLDVLRKHRSKQPINGVIVGISIEKLAGASPDDIEWHANKIRRRIDELIERLGVRFPVYLVFTKCDLLHGFVDFFDDLSYAEKQQVWGASFSRDRLAEEDGEDVREIFDAEFDELHETLLARRAERLSRISNPEVRRRVFLFPMEFAAVKRDLKQFVRWLFQPNPYQESPVWRGFYFTSGTQGEGRVMELVGAPAGGEDTSAVALGEEAAYGRGDGSSAPQDRALAQGRAAGRGPASVGRREEPVRSAARSYFIQELFTDIVIPDQYLVKRTSKATRRKQYVLAGTSVATLLALVLFALGSSQALFRSLDTVHEIEETAVGVEQVRWQTKRGQAPSVEEQRENFQHLRALDEQVATLVHYDEEAPFFNWGLYRGGQLLEPARTLQVQTARAFVRRYPYQRLRQSLQRAAAADDTTATVAAGGTSAYDDLKAYMLLTSDAGRLAEEENRAFLHDQLMHHVILPEKVARTDREQVREHVAVQVEAFIEGLRTDESASFAGDPALVSDVRNLIYEPPSIERIYKRLKEEGNYRMSPFTLGDALRGRGQGLFATHPEVPGFFTREAWNGYVEEAIEAQASKPSQVDWVMGYSIEDLPRSMRDADRVAGRLREMYFSEYVTAWKRFLTSVRVRRFGDTREAAQALERLGSAYDSPLLYLLAQATYQTTFGGGLESQARNRAEEAAERAADRQARRRFGRAGRIRDQGSSGQEENQHPVSSQFRWLHSFEADKAQSGGASPDLGRALRSLADVGNTLRGVSQNRSKVADFAAGILNENGGELAAALNSIRGSLSRFNPAVRDHLFSDPVRLAWRGVLGDTQQYLNRRWREEVYQPYQRQLSGRFPLAFDSEQDVPLNAFERFFRPQEGTLATFYQSALEPFLSERGDLRTWSGSGLQVDAQTRRVFVEAERIREGLFNGDVMRMPFELQPEQPASSPGAPAAGQVFINIHGRQLTYDMGNYRPWTQFEWPAGVGAVLRVSTQEGDLALHAEGAWAWFRLLKEARVQSQTSTRFQVRWPVGKKVVARYNMRTDRVPNPYGDMRGFFSFALPPVLATP